MNVDPKNLLDLAIIGGGPAGLSAGLYATRGGLQNVSLFEKGAPGGQITGSSEIENYPGVKDVTTGLAFMEPWQEQCFRFGLRHEIEDVLRIEKNDDIFRIYCADTGDTEKIFHAKAVIIATGGRPKNSGITGEREFFGRGVSTCATCDGFFYKNREVAVLGGGDTALEEAIFLTKICKKVYLIHRRDTFRAAPITVSHAKKNEKIEFLTPYSVTEIFGDENGVTGVRVQDLATKNTRVLNVPVIFQFVGFAVNNGVIAQKDGSFLCPLDEIGCLIVDLRMRTSVPGLFAAGDVRTLAARQVVCAAGDGATAAISAISYLEDCAKNSCQKSE